MAIQTGVLIPHTPEARPCSIHTCCHMTGQNHSILGMAGFHLTPPYRIDTSGSCNYNNEYACLSEMFAYFINPEEILIDLS